MQNKIINSEKKNSVLSTVITVLIWLIIILAAVRIFVGVTYVKVYVVGSSMSSTLTGAHSDKEAGGDYVYAFKSAKPHRGDIVVIKVYNDREFIIKRVIALGGDTVEVKNGVLYLNGIEKEEPYVLFEHNLSDANNFAQVSVPQGYMFCMGDNRDNSKDSRSEEYGCFPVADTVGIVADWSLGLKGSITAINTLFDFGV